VSPVPYGPGYLRWDGSAAHIRRILAETRLALTRLRLLAYHTVHQGLFVRCWVLKTLRDAIRPVLSWNPGANDQAAWRGTVAFVLVITAKTAPWINGL
jgi:hypothetical protein